MASNHRRLDEIANPNPLDQTFFAPGTAPDGFSESEWGVYGDALTADMVARDIAVHAGCLWHAHSLLCAGGPNVNWEADARREILYLRRKLAELEHLQTERQILCATRQEKSK